MRRQSCGVNDIIKTLKSCFYYCGVYKVKTNKVVYIYAMRRQPCGVNDIIIDIVYYDIIDDSLLKSCFYYFGVYKVKINKVVYI